jgi:hypothetical protein
MASTKTKIAAVTAAEISAEVEAEIERRAGAKAGQAAKEALQDRDCEENGLLTRDKVGYYRCQRQVDRRFFEKHPYTRGPGGRQVCLHDVASEAGYPRHYVPGDTDDFLPGDARVSEMPAWEGPFLADQLVGPTVGEIFCEFNPLKVAREKLEQALKTQKREANQLVKDLDAIEKQCTIGHAKVRATEEELKAAVAAVETYFAGRPASWREAVLERLRVHEAAEAAESAR